MKVSFKGRSVLPGVIRGQALVSHGLLNLNKSFHRVLLKKSNNLTVGDKKSDIYQKNISGKVLCVENFDSSNVDVLFLLSIFERACIAPICILSSKQLPNSILAGLIIAKKFYKTEIVVVDKLGDELLLKIETGDIISVCDDCVIVE